MRPLFWQLIIGVFLIGQFVLVSTGFDWIRCAYCLFAKDIFAFVQLIAWDEVAVNPNWEYTDFKFVFGTHSSVGIIFVDWIVCTYSVLYVLLIWNQIIIFITSDIIKLFTFFSFIWQENLSISMFYLILDFLNRHSL